MKTFRIFLLILLTVAMSACARTSVQGQNLTKTQYNLSKMGIIIEGYIDAKNIFQRNDGLANIAINGGVWTKSTMAERYINDYVTSISIRLNQTIGKTFASNNVDTKVILQSKNSQVETTDNLEALRDFDYILTIKPAQGVVASGSVGSKLQVEFQAEVIQKKSLTKIWEGTITQYAGSYGTTVSDEQMESFSKELISQLKENRIVRTDLKTNTTATRPPTQAIPVATSPTTTMPPMTLDGISDNVKEGFIAFTKKPLPRAFAFGGGTHWGYASGTSSKDYPNLNVSERALLNCQKSNNGKPCALYAVDNEVVYRKPN